MGKITREQILEFINTIPGAAVDQPFTMDFDTTILRHADTRKWFGAILQAPCRQLGINQDGEQEVINLKCDPLMAYGLIQSHSAIVPGYHMNKRHWISVILKGDVEMELLSLLIMDSFHLTSPKRPSPQNTTTPQQ